MVNLIVQSLNNLIDDKIILLNINNEFKKIKELIKEQNLKLIIWDTSFGIENNSFQQYLIANCSEELSIKYNKIVVDSKQKSLSLFYPIDKNIICCLHKEKIADRLLINLIENFNLKKAE